MFLKKNLRITVILLSFISCFGGENYTECDPDSKVLGLYGAFGELPSNLKEENVRLLRILGVGLYLECKRKEEENKGSLFK